MEITQKTVINYRKRLLDYMKNEKPFRKDFTTKTYILDMLYFMGLAIDEKEFYAAQGFDEFKKVLNEVINDS